MRFSFTRSITKQQGSAIMLAVFIVLVMSLLATALIRMIDSSQESVAIEVYGARALQAANSGVNVMASAIFPVSASAPTFESLPEVACADLPSNPIVQNLPNQNALGMANCNFVVNCVDDEISIAASTVRYYRFTSIGSCDFGEWVTSRTVQVEAKVL